MKLDPKDLGQTMASSGSHTAGGHCCPAPLEWAFHESQLKVGRLKGYVAKVQDVIRKEDAGEGRITR